MAQGLQVFDASGNLQVDITDRLARIIGSITLAAGSGGGSLNNAEFSTGTPWAFVVPQSTSENGVSTVSFSGTTMTFTATNSTITILYGVF